MDYQKVKRNLKLFGLGLIGRGVDYESRYTSPAYRYGTLTLAFGLLSFIVFVPMFTGYMICVLFR